MTGEACIRMADDTRQETRQCYAILHWLIGIIHILILRSEAKPPKYRTHFNKSLDGEIFINVKNKVG